ncbi:MAG: tetratricopeptide repeat protein [Elainellaceae cyanobacterium]
MSRVEFHLRQAGEYPVALDEPKTRVDGSVSDVYARLLLWCRRRRRGLARVEFSSEFARQRVVEQLYRDLRELDIPIHTLELPKWSSPRQVLHYLLESLDQIEPGVVSISGFATAFDRDIPLTDALRVINFNRENLVKPHLSQIWWMTRSFTDKALHAMPDLNSWFTLRLFLTESIRSDRQIFRDQEPNRTLAIPIEQDAERSGNLATIHNLPREISPRFVGREAELVQLHAQLQQSGKMAIAAIAGMGGIGKTELALHYATAYQADYRGGICWIRARDMDIGTQVIAFAQDRLSLSPPDGLDMVQQTHWCWQHWPRPDQDVLLIVDDVNDYERIVPYLPSSNRFKVLITTRLQTLGTAVTLFSLDLLSPEAAQALLALLIGEERVSAEPEMAHELCAWLGYLPLGIELIGTDLQRHPDRSLKTFYQTLQDRQADYSATRRLPPGVTAQIPLAVAFGTTWQSLPVDAQRLACLLSCFALAPIPWALVDGCFPNQDPDELTTIRDSELVSRSLLQQAGDSLYQLHPLIYQFIGMQREQSEWGDELKRVFCQEMVTIAKTIPETPVRTQILELTPVIPHLAEAATTWQTWLADEDLIWPFLGLGRFYAGQGAYSEAEPWYEMCLEVVSDRLGDEHPYVATSLNNLAALYDNQGRYSEAEPLYQQALAMSQRLLGDEHPDVATSLNNLAALYDNQGRYSEAEPLYQQALAMRQRLLGDEHPDVATSLNNLAALCRNQGRYSEAEPLYQQALAMRQRLLGDEHPAVASSLNNLAALYDDQGRYSEAEPLYQQALAMSQRLLGEEHPDVAQSLNNLAALYDNQGRYSEAEPLYQQALAIYQRLLGEEHPNVATSLWNLGALRYNQGRLEEAQSLLLRALPIYEAQLGSDHPNTRNLKSWIDGVQTALSNSK